mgnify:CR=1 FL=1
MKLACMLLLVCPLCYGQATKKMSENKAEEYYEKALEILTNTTHNALSKDLALKALDYSNKAVELNSTKSKYFRIRATSYFHLKNYDSALSNFNNAIRLDSTNSLAWMGKAIVLENTGKFELAKENYLQSLEFSDEPMIIYFNLGMLYSKWDKNDSSIQFYDKVIEMSPDDRSSYTNRGEVKLRARMYKEAIEDFDVAISLDTTDKVSYNNRGLCKFYLKYYKTAILDFEKALSINLGRSFDENYSTDRYSYNNMANSYFGLGNIDKACEYWKTAVQKGYQYKKEWKEIYNIDDPKELIKKFCK